LFLAFFAGSTYVIGNGGQKTTGRRKNYWGSGVSDKNQQFVCRAALILGAAVFSNRSMDGRDPNSFHEKAGVSQDSFFFFSSFFLWILTF
jgi:hypothetical protein